MNIQTVIKNLKPCLEGQEIQYQKLNQKYPLHQICDIINIEIEGNKKHQQGVYIEKQISVPPQMIPFIP